MAGKKKSGKKDSGLQTIVFLTALLNLIKSLIDVIKNLTGSGSEGKPSYLEDIEETRHCQDKSK